MKNALILAAALAVAPLSLAEAACPARVGVGAGDTVASIARRCGINVETLKRNNPGLRDDTMRPGTFVTVPRPPLPSAQQPYGQPRFGVAPSLVTPPTVGAPSTVILPPPQQPIPPQHVLPGFGNQPGQFPLPPLRP